MTQGQQRTPPNSARGSPSKSMLMYKYMLTAPLTEWKMFCTVPSLRKEPHYRSSFTSIPHIIDSCVRPSTCVLAARQCNAEAEAGDNATGNPKGTSGVHSYVHLVSWNLWKVWRMHCDIKMLTLLLCHSKSWTGEAHAQIEMELYSLYDGGQCYRS
eukprot:236030-Amphidinium_carterae.1